MRGVRFVIDLIHAIRTFPKLVEKTSHLFRCFITCVSLFRISSEISVTENCQSVPFVKTDTCLILGKKRSSIKIFLHFNNFMRPLIIIKSSEHFIVRFNFPLHLCIKVQIIIDKKILKSS